MLNVVIPESVLPDVLCTIANVDVTDRQWEQASLPINSGGLGIRSVSALAPSAFLASAAETRSTHDLILSSVSVTAKADNDVVRVKEIWGNYSKTQFPSIVGTQLQKRLDHLCTTAIKTRIQEELMGTGLTRFLAVSAPHAGDWLKCIPVSSCGLRLDDEAVRVAIG